MSNVNSLSSKFSEVAKEDWQLIIKMKKVFNI